MPPANKTSSGQHIGHRHEHRASPLQHGRAADPHVGRARPEHPRPPVRVRREDFVPAAYRLLAFADLEIPLGPGASMWSPKMEARVLQELSSSPGETRARNRHRQRLFHGAARRHGSASDERGDRPGARGRGRHQARSAPGFGGVELAARRRRERVGQRTYDAIVLTGSTPMLPDAFARQLNPGGRVFAVVGDAPVMPARLVRSVGTRSARDQRHPVRDRDRPADQRAQFLRISSFDSATVRRRTRSLARRRSTRRSARRRRSRALGAASSAGSTARCRFRSATSRGAWTSCRAIALSCWSAITVAGASMRRRSSPERDSRRCTTSEAAWNRGRSTSIRR